MKIRIYLVSSSPRRIKLLKKIITGFKILRSNIREEEDKFNSPDKLVLKLAEKKVLAVEKRIRRGLFLGFDTIVYFNGKIIGKPKNQEDAIRTLNRLNNKWHKVYTGVFILNKYESIISRGVEVSSVKFRKLSDKFISDYSKKHFDKAGAYAVQDKKNSPVEKIKGDYSNVVGFPVKLVRKLLGETNYDIK